MDEKRTSAAPARSSWSSMAFIVESMLLLVFLVASLSILTGVFSASLNESVKSRSLDAAVIAASSIAEHFAADPTDVQETTRLGDLVVKCDVTQEQRKSGILYDAEIKVYDSEEMAEPVYTLSTSAYDSEVS